MIEESTVTVRRKTATKLPMNKAKLLIRKLQKVAKLIYPQDGITKHW